MDKKVSVIIPCYNSERYLEACFETVKNQTIGIENLQVIFVDDCSGDGTVSLLEQFKEEYPESVNIICLPENRKQGGARNAGLSHASGEYVAFLDSDDWLDTAIYEKLYQTAVKYNTDILQYSFIHVYGSGQIVTDECVRSGYLDGTREDIKKGLLIGSLMTFGSQNKFYRRSLITAAEATFLEGVVYEEPSFVYPLFLKAERFLCMDEGLYYYRQDQQSVTGAYIYNKNKLKDHPYVQLEILKNLGRDKQVIEKYYNEIEYYFLFTYYVETLYFSGYNHLYLDVDYFKEMQGTVRELFPDYEENPYFRIKELFKIKEVLKSLNQSFTQDELEAYCLQTVKLLNG